MSKLLKRNIFTGKLVKLTKEDKATLKLVRSKGLLKNKEENMKCEICITREATETVETGNETHHICKNCKETAGEI